MYLGKPTFSFNRLLKAHKCVTSIKFNILTVNITHYQHLAESKNERVLYKHCNGENYFLWHTCDIKKLKEKKTLQKQMRNFFEVFVYFVSVTLNA